MADVTELNVLGPEKSFPRVSRAYPNMDAEFVRRGTPELSHKCAALPLAAAKPSWFAQLANPYPPIKTDHGISTSPSVCRRATALFASTVSILIKTIR